MPKAPKIAPAPPEINSHPYLDSNGALTKLALQQLKNPFNPEDIYWKPTNVKANKCIALAYADARTYQERLDLVFGSQNWSVAISNVYTAPYKIIKKARRKDWKDPESEIIEPEQIIDGHRVMVVVRVSVNGLGFRESSGVSESEDENSITTAEAQAFKRACSMYNIGKYLYFLPKYEDCEYSYGKIKNPPALPSWAIPAIYCEDCSNEIKTTEFKDKDDNVVAWNSIETTKRSQAHFGKDLCVDCMKKRKEANPPAASKRLKKTAEPEAKVADQGAVQEDGSNSEVQAAE